MPQRNVTNRQAALHVPCGRETEGPLTSFSPCHQKCIVLEAGVGVNVNSFGQHGVGATVASMSGAFRNRFRMFTNKKTYHGAANEVTARAAFSEAI